MITVNRDGEQRPRAALRGKLVLTTPGAPVLWRNRGYLVDRKRFSRLVARTLDTIPEEFRHQIHNVAILVEDEPRPRVRRSTPFGAGPRNSHKLLLGVFEGIPATKKSVFDVPVGPNRIVLYQKNIERICHNDAEIRHEIRQTLLHELGHYFGLTEAELSDV